MPDHKWSIYNPVLIHTIQGTSQKWSQEDCEGLRTRKTVAWKFLLDRNGMYLPWIWTICLSENTFKDHNCWHANMMEDNFIRPFHVKEEERDVGTQSGNRCWGKENQFFCLFDFISFLAYCFWLLFVCLFVCFRDDHLLLNGYP